VNNFILSLFFIRPKRFFSKKQGFVNSGVYQTNAYILGDPLLLWDGLAWILSPGAEAPRHHGVGA
jgi:hypothetical protein